MGDRSDYFVGKSEDFELHAPPRYLLEQAVRHRNGDFTIVNHLGGKTRVEFESDLWYAYRQWLTDSGISAPLTEAERQHWCGTPKLEEQAIDD